MAQSLETTNCGENDDELNQPIAIHFQITSVGSNLVINVTASENSLSISDAIGDTSLQQISNGY